VAEKLLQHRSRKNPVEVALKNDFRVLLMSTPTKYAVTDPALKGLNNILTIKENGQYNIITPLPTTPR